MLTNLAQCLDAGRMCWEQQYWYLLGECEKRKLPSSALGAGFRIYRLTRSPGDSHADSNLKNINVKRVLSMVFVFLLLFCLFGFW